MYSMEEKEIRYELFDCVKKFMKENNVECTEDVYQTDYIIENAYEFISDLFEIIKPCLSK